MRCRRPGPGRDDRGSASAELVLMTPLFFLFIAAVVYVGRLNVEAAQVEGAARSAARTISLARDPFAAVDDAHDAAATAVDDGSSLCPNMGFEPVIDVMDETVTVTVRCVVDVSAASFLEVPGSVEVKATVTEVIDRYREGPGP